MERKNEFFNINWFNWKSMLPALSNVSHMNFSKLRICNYALRMRTFNSPSFWSNLKIQREKYASFICQISTPSHQQRLLFKCGKSIAMLSMPTLQNCMFFAYWGCLHECICYLSPHWIPLDSNGMRKCYTKTEREKKRKQYFLNHH